MPHGCRHRGDGGDWGIIVYHYSGAVQSLQRSFKDSSSLSRFLLFLSVAMVLSIAVAGSYQILARHAFERSKHEEKKTILRLMDAYTRSYSALRSSDMPPPATFSKVAIDWFSETQTEDSETRILWVGMPGRHVSTAPTDEGMAADLEAMAANPAPKPTTKIVYIRRQALLRSIFPSIASQQNCVTCHNEFQRLSGENTRDWRVGEMMGAFVLDVPVDGFLKRLWQEAVIVGLSFFCITSAMALAFFWQNHRRVTAEMQNKMFLEVAEAIEAIDEGIAVFSSTGRMLVTNKSYRKRHGMDPDIRFDAPVMKTSWEERFNSKKWFKIDEARISSGIVIHLETDITALKEREEELMTAKMAAEAAGKARSSFLAMMSHELRTPLNAIIGFSELMMHQIHGSPGARYRDYAEDIHSSGLHLLALISDILDMAKIDAGKVELKLEAVSAAELLEDCRRLLARQAEENQVHLELDIADMTITVDPLRFKQIIINLLSNSIKFTPAGGRIFVTLIRQGSEVRIAVSDTGVGMAADDIPRAMEPFVQVGTMTSRRTDGTGLGLPLTKALVELHKGRFSINSELGVGTTVVVCLPAADVAAETAVPGLWAQSS